MFNQISEISKKIVETKILDNPFPHIVIDNLLSEDQFKKLILEIESCLNKEDNNLEYSDQARKKLSLDSLGEDSYINKLVKFFNSNEVLDLFKDKFNHFSKSFSKNHELYNSQPILVYNPNLKISKSPRKAHLDPENVYMTWLYYIKDESDIVTRIDLFKYKDKFIGFDYSSKDRMYLPNESIKYIKSINAIPNRLFAFIGGINSIHSVSERKANSKRRVYLTGGLNSDRNIFSPFKELTLKNKLRFLYRRPIQRALYQIPKLKKFIKNLKN